MDENREFGYTAKEWMMAFLQLADGNGRWQDIQAATGLREKRCKELAAMYRDATLKGWPRQ